MHAGLPPGRTAAALLCVVGLLAWSAGTAAADPGASVEEFQRQRAETRDSLSETRSSLERARGGLEDVEREKTATLADLEEADARRAELQAELDSLTMELAGARSVLAEADARLQETTAELAATREKLEDTRNELVEHQRRLAGRARASYMYGGTGRPDYTSALVGMGDVNEFRHASHYVRRVVASDQQQIDLVAGLERQVEARAGELAELEQRQAVEREYAAAERDRVAGLVADHRELREEADVEAERHRKLVAELEGDEQTKLAMIDSLESESAQLSEELEEIARAEQQAEAEAEAQRRAEARARQRAQEQARQAAAERAAKEAAAARRAAERAARSAAPSGGDASSGSSGSGSSGFHAPAAGPVTSGFGYRTHPIYGSRRLHAGVDLGGGTGAPIYAADDGVVVSSGWRGGYGNAVVISHGGGVATLYAHQSNVGVRPGQRVSRGQLIGRIGCTGSCTGPHLHFEVRVNGQPRDPMRYL